MPERFRLCETCRFIGEVSEFQSSNCPKCASEDVFPVHVYKCSICGNQGLIEDFFSECGVDDPTEYGIAGECPECDRSDGIIEINVTLEEVTKIFQEGWDRFEKDQERQKKKRSDDDYIW